MKTNGNYTFKKENGKFFLFDREKPLLTPKGNPVFTLNDSLARKIVKELSRSKGAYTSPASVLCYHYTYCDLCVQYSREDIVNDLKTYVTDNLDTDDYLMLRQGDAEAGIIAASFKEVLPMEFKVYNMYQLMAVMVVLCSFDSVVLSHRFVEDIVRKLDAEQTNLPALKKSLIADLREYYADEDVDQNELNDYLSMIDKTIEAFVCYFNVKD